MENKEVFELISTISMTFIENDETDYAHCGFLADAIVASLKNKFGNEGVSEFAEVTVNDAIRRIVKEFAE
jgi:hypothetical protein